MSNPALAIPALASQRRAIIRNDAVAIRSDLNYDQTSAELGQAIPIVFGKRQNNAGGVWISAPAVLARFTNDTANQVTASYELVLADGQLTISTGDVYQGDTPLTDAEWDIAYGDRAGTWAPGNLIQQRFNVTTSRQAFSVEGKAIGNDSAGALDLGGLSSAEVAQVVDNSRAVVEVSSSGNYVTFFQVLISKTVNWPTKGVQAAYKGSLVVGQGTTTGFADFNYSNLPWTLADDPSVRPSDLQLADGEAPKIVPYLGAQYWFGASNGWIYDRGVNARYMPTATYTVDRAASTEAYGDLELTFTEQIRPGFISQQTATQTTGTGELIIASLFGGLPGVRYDVAVEEINSEPLPKPEATLYCGVDTGSFSGLTTLSVTKEWPAGDDRFRRQIHAFAREGTPVPRLIEGTTGASNLFPDLVRRLMVLSSRVPTALIDVDRLTIAARFNDALDLRCDALISNPTNLPEFIDRLADLFLLRPSNRWGRLGLRPAVPITAGYQINTGTISPVKTFDEQQVMGSPSIRYVPRSERQPFAVLATWRDQPTNDLAVIQATEVRYSGEALEGPYEDLDGSEFITRETHAIRAGAYRLARRRHITHTMTLTLQPTADAAALVPGDVIRFNQARNPTIGGPTIWSYLYEVERISGPPLGPWSLELTHFPVDIDGRSLVARDVAAAA